MLRFTAQYGRSGHVGTHEPCVPTCNQTNRGIGHIDNQRLTPCISIPAILRCNFSHFTTQYGWDCALKWAMLQTEVIHVANRLANTTSQTAGYGSCIYPCLQKKRKARFSQSRPLCNSYLLKIETFLIHLFWLKRRDRNLFAYIKAFNSAIGRFSIEPSAAVTVK